MGICKICKDIMTVANGEDYDVSRVVMTVNSLMLIPTLIIGEVIYAWSYFLRPDKLFDVQTFFTAILTFEVGVASLLMGGAASIFMKKKTEPDGQINQSEPI